MDRLIGVEEFADDIEEVMRDRGFDRDQAAIIVAMRHGDLVGDVLVVGPISDEEKRRRRMTLREVMQELGELDNEQPDPGEPGSSLPPDSPQRVAS